MRTRKHKNEEKIIVKAKLIFPFEFHIATLAIFFFTTVTLYKLFVEKVNLLEWFLIFLFCMSCFIFIILLGRSQFKNMTIYMNKISYKPIYSLKEIIIEKDNIKGFELFETAVQGGLDFNIRIITTSDIVIKLPKDNYSNYNEIINGLHKSDIYYLGRVEYKGKYKNAYLIYLKWISIVFPIIYGLFLLLKAKKIGA
jgi:hypothetical protein